MSARRAVTLATLHEEIIACRACPRLVEWRERVAREKRRAYREETYWGRPITGFGDPAARLVIVGLAPGAHGANRTGRVFTGDRSGDFLFAALYRCGLASQPTSVRPGDGLTLRGVFITISCRCAPPDNHPSREELAACEPFLAREIALLPEARAFLALGKIAYDAVVGLTGASVAPIPHPADSRPAVRASRSRAAAPARTVPLLASYHVSQQNTQTGRLTPAMFDAVVRRAARAAGLC
jgi:uracil-DNA glycosylase family 4